MSEDGRDEDKHLEQALESSNEAKEEAGSYWWAKEDTAVLRKMDLHIMPL